MPIFLFLPMIFSQTLLSGPGFTTPKISVSDPLEFPANRAEPLSNIGSDVSVFNGKITAFAAALDPENRILVALATPESLLHIYSSLDTGTTWHQEFSLVLNSAPSRLEMASGKGDSSYIFVFYLTPENSGDLYLLRISPDFTDWVEVPIAIGPDTVDDFSVALDREPRYYLYCLYTNEHALGRNGRFTRSLDFGLTWEMPQDFYNCLDPYLSFGSGSILHCIWRFALNGREIHYTQNRHFGAPARWDWLRVLSATSEKCYSPVVAQAETAPPYRAPIWAVWTIARRDTEMLDLVFSYSTDGGNTFSPMENLGEMFVDEWWPAIVTSPSVSFLVYNSGGKEPNSPTVVYFRYSRPWAPNIWSSPVILNDARANALFESARPRVILPGILFSYYHPDFVSGILFERLSLRPEPLPVIPFSDPFKKAAQKTNLIFDVTGRQVQPSTTKPGVYFCYDKNHTQKLLIIK
ncbi:MAG: hypothetical protein ABIK18_06080 [candidate division WOR-3 bacterium]